MASFDLAATLDHVGPMARSAADAAALLTAIAAAIRRSDGAARSGPRLCGRARGMEFGASG